MNLSTILVYLFFLQDSLVDVVFKDASKTNLQINKTPEKFKGPSHVKFKMVRSIQFLNSAIVKIKLYR